MEQFTRLYSVHLAEPGKNKPNPSTFSSTSCHISSTIGTYQYIRNMGGHPILSYIGKEDDNVQGQYQTCRTKSPPAVCKDRVTL